jgi:hypothetical protein
MDSHWAEGDAAEVVRAARILHVSGISLALSGSAREAAFADGQLTPRLVPAHHAVQHPDAEVEALQQQEPRPQDGKDDEPEVGECHQ